jgi:hypothetical protein
LTCGNSFSGAGPHGEKSFADLEQQLWQKAKIQHYDDASTTFQHLLQLRYFSTRRVSWRIVGNAESEILNQRDSGEPEKGDHYRCHRLFWEAQTVGKACPTLVYIRLSDGTSEQSRRAPTGRSLNAVPIQHGIDTDCGR